MTDFVAEAQRTQEARALPKGMVVCMASDLNRLHLVEEVGMRILRYLEAEPPDVPRARHELRLALRGERLQPARARREK